LAVAGGQHIFNGTHSGDGPAHGGDYEERVVFAEIQSASRRLAFSYDENWESGGGHSLRVLPLNPKTTFSVARVFLFPRSTLCVAFVLCACVFLSLVAVRSYLGVSLLAFCWASRDAHKKKKLHGESRKNDLFLLHDSIFAAPWSHILVHLWFCGR
jgi:hypothetical protein